MATIISGKELASAIRAEIASEAASFLDKNGRAPGLAVVLVGDDPASKIYVRNKHAACKQCGIRSLSIELPASTTERQLLRTISSLNADDSVDGILVQLPLPDHIDAKKVIERVDPLKDVDGFHPVNVGRLSVGSYTLAPCTPSGVMEMLRRTGIDVCGKKCVVIGRSNIVGKPMGMMLLHANGTVTLCHTKTADLKAECRTADILVSAAGQAGLVTADMVKPGAVVIDVSINRGADGKLCGDALFDEVSAVASYISPVPGGVGPMTITMLMKNTLIAARERVSKTRR